MTYTTKNTFAVLQPKCWPEMRGKESVQMNASYSTSATSVASAWQITDKWWKEGKTHIPKVIESILKQRPNSNRKEANKTRPDLERNILRVNNVGDISLDFQRRASENPMQRWWCDDESTLANITWSCVWGRHHPQSYSSKCRSSYWTPIQCPHRIIDVRHTFVIVYRWLIHSGDDIQLKCQYHY